MIEHDEATCAVITRMPTTGQITNLFYADRPVEEIKKLWDDTDCVTIVDIKDFDKQCADEACPTCGDWCQLGHCSDCR